MAEFLDITGLGHFKDKLDTANELKFVKKTELDSTINDKLTNVYRYKGTKPSYEQLPQTGNTAGDVWDVNGGMNYAWDGTQWDALGESKVEITIDAELSSNSENPVQNKVVYSALQGKASTTDATKVTQSVSTDDVEYPILIKNSGDTTTVTDTTKFGTGVTINPNTKTITASIFKGTLDGNAATATKASTADTATTAENATNATVAASCTGNAATATTAGKLTAARKLGVALGTNSALGVDFDGSEDQLAIPVSGKLGIANGGTGASTPEEAWTALGGGDIGKLSKGTSTTTFLRNDGTWATPEGTVYTAISDEDIDALFV